MTRDIHSLAARLQDQLLRAHAVHGPLWVGNVPRVMLDAWASLVRWHECGERVWRISAAAADETADMLLPADLPLSTARVRAEAVCYQLQDRDEWVILARHAPAPCEVIVRDSVRWAYAQPVLTYCTIYGGLCAGYYSLADHPTPAKLPNSILPGTSLGIQRVRQLADSDVCEEDARLALALIHHYLPSP